MRARSRTILLGVAVTAIVVAGVVVAVHLASEPSPAELRAEAAARARARLERLEHREVAAAERLVAPVIPTRTGVVAPSGVGGLFKVPLASHEVFGFVPYWTLASLTPADYASASTLCYFGPSLQKDATFTDTDPDWNTAAFSSFVSAGHTAGDRVLLTVASTDNSVIGDVLAHPARSAERLAGQAADTLSARGLDGVDIDFESTQPAERESFVAFVAAFRTDLVAARPGAQVVVDTYVSAAGNPDDFFDVRGLGRVADELFVMGYDMYDGDEASANAPLYAKNLDLSDVQALIDYTKLVPAQKLVLGVPFYGDEFSSAPGAGGDDAAPEALTYANIVTAGHVGVWDPVSRTPYAEFATGGTRHVIWYDDPVSIALKSALAQVFHLGGVGVWALGMEGGDPTMLEALTGNTTPLRAALTGG